MKALRYTTSLKERWDRFVDDSKNGTFLFHRGYMDYHSDRFEDFSVVITDDKDAIVALFPANIKGSAVVSHGGLTYGGVVLSDAFSGAEILNLFDVLVDFLKRHGIRSVVYKPVPWIYHRQPSEEDLYALFRLKASLIVRNLSTAINLTDPISSSRLGKRALKRQRKNHIRVSETDDVNEFWNIVIEDRRERHNVVPVHTAAELMLLKSRFPDNIRFFTALKEETGEVLGGAVIYLDRGVIHLQYAACTHEGKDLYATDVIYHELIYNIMAGNRFFDFGISNEDGGWYLNEGMVRHKEEFGGRSVVYDMYEIKL